MTTPSVERPHLEHASFYFDPGTEEESVCFRVGSLTGAPLQE
jgi:hypothetical protein